jgi:hypothetical protein
MKSIHVCDSCDAEWWGASKRDALGEGWKFHDAKGGRLFVMCGDCEQRFGGLRAQGRAAAAPALEGSAG